MNTMINRLSGAALLFVLMMGSAWAGTDTGTMAFTGTLTAASCNVDSPSITLVTTPVSLLGSAGLFAGRKAFNVTLSGCSGSYANVGLHFVYDSSKINSATGCLKNTDSGAAAAKYVEICLRDNNLNKLDLYTNTLESSSTQYTVANGVTTITYYAEYTATGIAEEGTVHASSTFNLFYN